MLIFSLFHWEQFISSVDADIIGFQEVRLEVFHQRQSRSTTQRKGFATQPQVSQLAKYLPGFQYVYQPAMLYTDRLPERSEEGLAIFSRYPILSSDYILLYRYRICCKVVEGGRWGLKCTIAIIDVYGRSLGYFADFNLKIMCYDYSDIITCI